MSSRLLTIDDAFYGKFQRSSLREPGILKRLRGATANHPSAVMQISPEQGQVMRLPVALLGARRIIEIGGSPATAAWP
ncbi:MAG: hypothetical protein OEN20_05075 [Gammaproteobacteria bacterium]|nr:hypothetical protein [Gammaproteobacteria bacterium]